MYTVLMGLAPIMGTIPFIIIYWMLRPKMSHFRPDDVVLLKCEHVTSGNNIYVFLGERGKNRTWCENCQDHLLIIRMANLTEISDWLETRRSKLTE